MTITSLPDDVDASVDQTHVIQPDLLTDLLDPLLTHMVRHWWQSQHEQLATPEDPQPPIPAPPVHILQVVPRPMAPSATLAALAPSVTVPPQWSTSTGHGYMNVDTASCHGKVWLLDAFLKLYRRGRFPPKAAKADLAVSPSADEHKEHGEPDSLDIEQGNSGSQEAEGHATVEDEEVGGESDALSDGPEDNDEDIQDEVVHLLDPCSLLMESKCPFMYSKNALNAASVNNSTLVLDWWLKLHCKDPHQFPLGYTEEAMDNASWAGHVQVLDWWLESGLELRYSWAALADASEAGHVHVLEWWLQAEKEGKLVRDCSARVLDRASFENRISVLDFWVDQGELPTLNDKYSDQAIAIAAARGHVDVLKWWRSKADAGVFPACAWVPEKVARSASSRVKMEVLDWMLEDGVLTEEVKKDLVRKLSFVDGAEFNEWKQEVRDWWGHKAGVVIPTPVSIER